MKDKYRTKRAIVYLYVCTGDSDNYSSKSSKDIFEVKEKMMKYQQKDGIEGERERERDCFFWRQFSSKTLEDFRTLNRVGLNCSTEYDNHACVICLLQLWPSKL